MVDAVHGGYEGTINSDASTMSGSWSQGQPLPLDFKRGVALPPKRSKPATPSDFDGTWLGTLDTGATKLRMVFYIINTKDGLTATADSPNQGAKGIPVTTVTRNGSSLKLEMEQLGGVYEGVIGKDRQSINGSWT